MMVWLLRRLGYHYVRERTNLRRREYITSIFVAVGSIAFEVAFTALSIITALGYLAPDNVPSFGWTATILARYAKVFLFALYQYITSTLYIVAPDGSESAPKYGNATYYKEVKHHTIILMLISIVAIFLLVAGWRGFSIPPDLQALPITMGFVVYFFVVGIYNCLGIVLLSVGYRAGYIHKSNGHLSRNGTYETKKKALENEGNRN